MILRVFLAVAVIASAILVTPEMLEPGVNSADLIVIAAPFLLVLIFAARRSQTPAGDSASPSVTATPTPTAETPAGPSL